MPQDPFDDIVRGYDQQFAPPKVKPVKPAKPPSFDDLVKDVDGQTGSVPTRREQRRQNITALQDELTATSPQVKPGNTLNVTTGRQYPTPPPPPFQSPIDMRLNAPNEAQKAFDRAAAAVQPAPQTPAPRPKQTLGQMRQQARNVQPVTQEDILRNPVTPEERKASVESFIAKNEREKKLQQAAAKAKLEEEASRASQSTLGRMGTRFARGAVRGTTQTPFEFVQMVNPDPVVQQTMKRIADDSKEWQSQNLPVDNRNPATLNVFKPEFYSLDNVSKAATENIPEVLGEMLPQMALARGAGGVARAATAIPRIAPTTAAEFAEQAAAQLAARKGAELAARTAAGGYGAAQQSTQAYQKALDAGMTPEQAARAAAIEAPIGFSEFLGSPGTTGFTRPGTTIRREMREEGLQELGQTAASGLAGKYASGYDANKPLLDIAGESIGSGILGGVTGGIVATPGARLQARQQAQQQRATRSAIDQRSAANAAAITPQPVQAQPVTEPLTEPLAAQPQPSAPVTPQVQPQGFPRLPEPENFNARRAKLLGMPVPAEVGINEQVQAAAQLLDSPNEGDRRDARIKLNKALRDLRQSEGYLAEMKLPPDAPRPFTAVRDAIEARLKPAPKAPKGLNPEVQKSVDLAKQDAVEAEQAGNYEAAANHWKAAHSSLVAAQREIRRSGNAEQIKAIATDISIADANRRKAMQAARTAQRQANAPTAGLPENPQSAIRNPQSTEAPLLRPDAVQNPEGGIPQMPEPSFTDRLEAAARRDASARGKAKPAKRLLSRIAELGGISDRYAGELQDVKDARRIGVIRQKAEMSPDVLARQLQSEGYDVDPEDLNTLWEAARRDIAGRGERTSQTSELERRLAEEEAAYNERQPFDQIVADVDAEPTNRLHDAEYEGGEVQRYSKPLEGQDVEREAFQPDTADLREVREFGKREPRTEQFTEEPPTAPLARRRQPIRPPAPASPRQVGNRPLSVDVAGTRTPVAMSPEFPRARREMVRQGREVEARLTEGQEKGEFGNVAEAMFKSNTPDVLHGQDSFFHDPDLKGKLGLTRDAEMADVRRELKTQLARSLGLSAEEVSLSHIKPEVWRAWAKQKGLGREAVRKLEAGIARAERKQRATETNAQIVAEESQRAQSEVRQPAAKAGKSIDAQIKDIRDLQKFDLIDDKEAKRKIAALEAQRPKIAERREAPGFFSQLERVIDAKMPAKASAAQVRAIIENPQSGVKPEEVKWTGLDDYLRGKETVTKADVQEFLKANNVQVEESLHRNTRPINNLERSTTASPTKYDTYTLPGGENYRELLLTLPEKREAVNLPSFDNWLKDQSWYQSWKSKGADMVEARRLYEQWSEREAAGKSNAYRSSHFDEPNILAHIRFNERTDADGKRVLHIEEIQSDWHQEGRKKGYVTKSEIVPHPDKPKSFAIKEDGEYVRWDFRGVPKVAEYLNRGAAERALSQRNTVGQKVPDAPFKKTWHELAFKRALRWAAENGYERMTWTTGEQQADRFDLSKQVKAVFWQPSEKILSVRMPDGETRQVASGISEDKLADYIGKEAAGKIVKPEAQSTDIPPGGRRLHVLTGDNLKVGGEGMKGFYDQILPAFANKYGRKWGARVGSTEIKTADSYEAFNERAGRPETIDEPKYESVHSIDITPAMRESVMQGQPKFRREASGAMPERYTGRQLFENAQLTFRPARNRPATLVANDWGGAMLNRLLSEKFDVTTTDANFTIGAKDAKDLRDYLAEAKDSGIYEPAQVANMDAMLRQMDAAIADAEVNQQDVAFVTRRPAEPISATKAKIRHEAAHLSQSRIAADLSALTGKNWLDSQSNAADIHKELDRRGYAPETHDYEAAAFVASGDYGVFGMNTEQAAKFLSDYFGAVVETHGKRALRKFGAIAPQLQPTLEAARRETESGQTANERRSTRIASTDARGRTTPGEAGRSRASVFAERRGGRQGTDAGFSVGRLRNEPQGELAASGLGGFQSLFDRKKTPKQPTSYALPKGWNADKWARKFYTDTMVAALPKDLRKQYDKADTQKQRNAIILNAPIDPKLEQEVFAFIDKVADATQKGDGGALYDLLADHRKFFVPPRTKAEKAKVAASDLLNLPRAMMASMDISAPLRQGAILTLPPTQWGKAAKAGVRMFEAMIPDIRLFGKQVTQSHYRDIQKRINLHPDAEIAKDAGLYLSTDETGLRQTEEDFLSNWTQHIPIVKQSEQAYKAYLDTLRIETFARYKKSIDKAKLTAEQKEDAYQAAADWINVASGRGSLGKTFDAALPALSKVLFAPRYAASRIQVLNPVTYAKNVTTPAGLAVLKGQMSDLVQFSGMIAATLALAAAAGAEVNDDPDDSDFLKIKVGNVRYDVLAGLQQPMRLFYRMGEAAYTKLTGQKSSSRQDAVDIAARYGRSKLAPVPSFFVDALTGKTYPGEDFDAQKGVIDRVTPLMWRDFYEAYQKEGLGTAVKILPGAVGIGVQNYGERKGSLKESAFTKEAAERGKDYDFLRKRPGEPDAVYQKRVERVSGWMDEYGQKLLNHPRYKAMPEADQKAAIESLRRRIGAQQNLTRPKLASLEPNAVLLSLQRSKAGKAKRERSGKYLYTPQP